MKIKQPIRRITSIEMDLLGNYETITYGEIMKQPEYQSFSYGPTTSFHLKSDVTLIMTGCNIDSCIIRTDSDTFKVNSIDIPVYVSECRHIFLSSNGEKGGTGKSIDINIVFRDHELFHFNVPEKKETDFESLERRRNDFKEMRKKYQEKKRKEYAEKKEAFIASEVSSVRNIIKNEAIKHLNRRVDIITKTIRSWEGAGK